MFSLNKIFESELKKVDEHIVNLLKSDNEKMQEIMNWIIKTREENLTSQLLILSSKFGEPDTDVSEYAAIIEILYMASLVYDDVINNTDKKGSLLSVQEKFGKNSAVYARDYMLFSILESETVKDIEDYKDFYSYLRRICYGELGRHSNLYNFDKTVDEYIKNITDKTAAIFELACEIGGLISNSDDNLEKYLANYGRAFGVVYQMRSDLLDYNNINFMENSTYKDFKNGIYTLPVIYTSENQETKNELIKIKNKVKENGFNNQLRMDLTNIINKADGFKKSGIKLKESYEAAIHALKHFPDRIEKAYFKNIIDDLYIDTLKLL